MVAPHFSKFLPCLGVKQYNSLLLSADALEGNSEKTKIAFFIVEMYAPARGWWRQEKSMTGAMIIASIFPAVVGHVLSQGHIDALSKLDANADFLKSFNEMAASQGIPGSKPDPFASFAEVQGCTQAGFRHC